MKLKNVFLVILSCAVLVLGGLFLYTLNSLAQVKDQASRLSLQVQQLSEAADQVVSQAAANSELYQKIIGLVPEEASPSEENQNTAQDAESEIMGPALPPQTEEPLPTEE